MISRWDISPYCTKINAKSFSEDRQDTGHPKFVRSHLRPPTQSSDGRVCSILSTTKSIPLTSRQYKTVASVALNDFLPWLTLFPLFLCFFWSSKIFVYPYTTVINSTSSDSLLYQVVTLSLNSRFELVDPFEISKNEYLRGVFY